MSETKNDTRPAPSRPLPSLHELDTAPFWKATSDGRLTYPVCKACETVVFYPRAHCTSCLSDDLEWRESSGRGTVYTFSIVRQSYHPFFRGIAPYAVAWIDLDEGPRLASNVIEIDPDSIEIGMAVELVWEEHEELSVPLFKPAN